MPTANVNRADLEALLKQLHTFNDSFRNEWQRLKASWGMLDSRWSDQQKEKFRRDWDQSVREMERYLQESDKYIQFLEARVRAVRKFEENT